MNAHYIVVICIATLLGGILTSSWLKARTESSKNLSKVYFITPLLIIVAISYMLIKETVWQADNIQKEYSGVKQDLLEDKWQRVLSQINMLQAENFEMSEKMSKSVIGDLQNESPDVLNYSLENISSKDNIVRASTDRAIKGKYFRGDISETNDPFAIVIGKGIEDSYLISNFSQSFTTEQPGANLQQDFLLFDSVVGSSILAKSTINKLIKMESGLPPTSYLFLQVKERPDNIDGVLDINSLKSLFIKYEGDVEKTFKGIEFLAPYYIYRNESISGSPRVDFRVKTDAKSICIVSSFGYINILNNDKNMYNSIHSFDNLIKLNKEKYTSKSNTTLIVGILIFGIIYVLLILFWMFIHMNMENLNKDNN